MKQKRDLDFSGVDNGRGNSDDEEDHNASEVSNNGSGSRYNLLAYNKDRKIRLNEFDYTMDEGDDEEENDFDK